MNIGETVKVKLEIDKTILGEVIESFGNQTKIEPALPSSNRLIVHVKSSESPSSDLEICIEDYYSDEDYRKEVLFDFCDELVGGWV